MFKNRLGNIQSLIIRNSFWYLSLFLFVFLFLSFSRNKGIFLAISGQLGTAKDVIVKTSIAAYTCGKLRAYWLLLLLTIEFEVELLLVHAYL